ncbi:MAG TPA: M20/M25/M40 family metallo-hydrolase, partial [Clostridia bacterium]|nr:M20/M25/M40 family metallo-hydrolase [Clostridia bacterium]
MSRKQRALAILDSLMPGIQDLGQRLFQTPELGFKEYETAALIGQYLSDHGMTFEEGIALTGVRAKLGQEGYHVALVADMDALEVQGSQGPFVMHACGHSIQLAIMLAVIHSLHILDKEAPLAGQVSFMATPAEEFLDLDYRRGLIAQGKIAYPSGKQNMI